MFVESWGFCWYSEMVNRRLDQEHAHLHRESKQDKLPIQSDAAANHDDAIITISKLAALDLVLQDPKLMPIRSEVL